MADGFIATFHRMLHLTVTGKIHEASIQFENLFIRADVLIKDGRNTLAMMMIYEGWGERYPDNIFSQRGPSF